MTEAELLRALNAAGVPESRRADVAAEISWIIEVHQAGESTEPKPTEQFKKIGEAAQSLRDQLDTLPASWRLSLGVVINDKGEWCEATDWRPALELLAARADTMTRDQEGNPPKRGAPFDGKFYVLLLNLVELWEREQPGIVGVKRNAWDSGAVESLHPYKGPLLDLVTAVLTGYKIEFKSSMLGRTLQKIIKTAEVKAH